MAPFEKGPSAVNIRRILHEKNISMLIVVLRRDSQCKGIRKIPSSSYTELKCRIFGPSPCMQSKVGVLISPNRY